MIAVRFIVRGRVQGVFFRASTRARAAALGVTGSARNRDDGSVEVMAFGSPEAIASLERWLWQGPPAARVDSVTREDLQEIPPAPIGFEIG